MKLRPFELALVIIFGGLAGLALFLLSTYDPPKEEGAIELTGKVAIWGTVPDGAFKEILDTLAEKDQSFRNVSYRYIAPENFDATFINALAERTAPDLIFIHQEQLIEYRSKIQPLSYEEFPLVDYRMRYVEGAEIFTMPDGLYALPVAVDPLMMYWNRDIFSTAGYVIPPTTWEQVVGDVVPKITSKNFNREIQRATLAMGQYENVKNSFGILSMLFIQGGSKLVVEEQGTLQVRLNESLGAPAPFNTAIAFFTRFANTNNQLYTWNRTLPLDRDFFLSEDLALYFGFGSEARELESKNPNLNFAIAEVPQGASATQRRTYGRVYGLAVVRNGTNQNGAATVLGVLAGEDLARQIAVSSGMAPAYRASYLGGSNDVYGRLIFSSAPIARGWLNPDMNKVDEVFRSSIGDIQANRVGEREGAEDANNRIRLAY